ncbi:hypothetical protein KM043_010102 [Ampulex compressa]|nr:hypothetical protein KM043_010102 [Ampulex compressa]
MEEFNEFRSKCGLLWSYDWVSIPLVYTQVVTLATYSFFAVALVGRQYIEGAEKQFQLKIDIYLPVFTVLQFFFFMGLLKVAEQLINPFGDDDEDFELNWLIDRHTKVSYLGVDALMNRCPPLVKDIYFDSEDLTLPYTEAAAAYKKKTYRGSVAHMTVPEEKQTMFLPDILEEEEDTKVTPTPRTSTASLATHPNDSPVDEKRQISGAPQTTPKMDRNCSETVLQMDIQESPTDVEQPEQRRVITEAVKRFSALARSSTPRIDQNRKPFFPVIKAPRVILQPWPSATNVAKMGKQTIDSPAVSDDVNPWTRKPCRTILEATRLQAQEEEAPRSFVNSAFDRETSREEKEARREEGSPVEVGQCLQLEVPDDLPYIDEPAKPRPNTKLLVRRQKSNGSLRKKRSLQWKQIIEDRPGRFRRRTTDAIPTVEKVIPLTMSSPNLRDLDDRQSVAKEPGVEASNNVEDVSRLLLRLRLDLDLLFMILVNFGRQSCLETP